MMFSGRKGEKLHENIIFPANNERFWGKAKKKKKIVNFVNFVLLNSTSDHKQHA